MGVNYGTLCIKLDMRIYVQEDVRLFGNRLSELSKFSGDNRETYENKWTVKVSNGTIEREGERDARENRAVEIT